MESIIVFVYLFVPILFHHQAMNILNLKSNLNLLKIYAMDTHYFRMFLFIT